MGVWKKSPKIAPAEHTRLQQIISADPEIRALRDQAGRASMQAGKSVGWSDISDQTRKILQRKGIQLPDGYEVNMSGELVYTNKTPFLQQAAWGALPIGAVSAVGALTGAGAAGAGGGTAAAGGVLPSSHLPAAALMGGPGAIASGVAGAAGGAAGIGGSVLDWFKNPRNLIGLAPIIGALASRGGGGGFSGGGQAGDDFINKAYDEAQRINAMKESRFRRVDPLHEAVTQLAFNRLPDSARQGINLQRTPLPPERT